MNYLKSKGQCSDFISPKHGGVGFSLLIVSSGPYGLPSILQYANPLISVFGLSALTAALGIKCSHKSIVSILFYGLLSIKPKIRVPKKHASFGSGITAEAYKLNRALG